MGKDQAVQITVYCMPCSTLPVQSALQRLYLLDVGPGHVGAVQPQPAAQFCHPGPVPAQQLQAQGKHKVRPTVRPMLRLFVRLLWGLMWGPMWGPSKHR